MPQPSKKLIAIGLVLVVAIAAVSIWLGMSRRSSLPDDRVTRLAVSTMSSDLRGLMMAEEATRRIRGRYVADPEEAGHISSVGVTTPRIILSDTGYTATVEYKTIPGIHCAIGVFARNPLKRFAKNGEVVCE